MPDKAPCDICENQAEYELIPPLVTWRCPRCGEFCYNSSEGPPKIRSPDEMVRLSGWVREQNAAGVVPVPITMETSRRVAQMRPPGLRDRASRVLAIIARSWPGSDASFSLDLITQNVAVQGSSYSRDEQEVVRLIDILIDDGYLKPIGVAFALSVKGLLAAEALGAAKSSSAQGFVAMSFDESLRDAWTNGFDPGIRAAGFRPLRLDNEDYVGGITDEIMAQIRRSRFVVADYTAQRNSVYFEAGFALGLGLTVIPTCRADEVDNLHFDIKHLNTLPWNTPAELVDGLNRRIRAVIGVGPDAPDPS
jgi:hypothetical protein